MMENKLNYVEPLIEVLEVQVESGFAVSGDPVYPTWGGEEPL